jgi:hypothetical protein
MGECRRQPRGKSRLVSSHLFKTILHSQIGSFEFELDVIRTHAPGVAAPLPGASRLHHLHCYCMSNAPPVPIHTLLNFD